MPQLEGGARFAAVGEFAAAGTLASARSAMLLLAALAGCAYLLLLRRNLQTDTACGFASEVGAAVIIAAAGGLAIFLSVLQDGPHA